MVASSRTLLIGLVVASTFFAYQSALAQWIWQDSTSVQAADAQDLYVFEDVFYTLTVSGKLFQLSDAKWEEVITIPETGYMRMISTQSTLLVFTDSGKVFEFEPNQKQLTQLENEPFIRQHSKDLSIGNIYRRKFEVVNVNSKIYVVVNVDTTAAMESHVYILGYEPLNSSRDSTYLTNMGFEGNLGFEFITATHWQSKICILGKRWTDQNYTIWKIDPESNWRTEIFSGPPETRERWIDTSIQFSAQDNNLYVARRYEVLLYDQQLGLWKPLWQVEPGVTWYNDTPRLKSLAVNNEHPFVLSRFDNDAITRFLELIPDPSDPGDFQFELDAQELKPIGRQVKEAFRAVLSDLDGDMDLDLVLLYGGSYIGIQIVTHLNDGAGSFGPPTVLYEADITGFLSYTRVWLEVADVDNDGDQDILLGSGEVEITRPFNLPDGWKDILLNDGTGSFTPISLDNINFSGFFKVDDFDADGRNDVFSRHAGFSLIRGAEELHLMSSYPQNFSFEVGITTIADVDSDGYPDAVLARFYNNPVLALNNGNGQLRPKIKFGAEVGLQVALGDLNQDGQLDAIIGGSYSPPLTSSELPSLYISYTSEQGFFAENVLIAQLEANVSRVELVDLDLDNDLDIVVALSHQVPARLKLFRNMGNGQFHFQGLLAPPANGEFNAFSFYDLAIGDVNGDYKPDILAATYSINDGRNEERFNALYINKEPRVVITEPQGRPDGLLVNVREDIANISWNPTSESLLTYEVRISKENSDVWISHFGSPKQPFLGNSRSYNDLPLGEYEVAIRYWAPNYQPSRWSETQSFSITAPDATPPSSITMLNVEPYLPYETLSNITLSKTNSQQSSDFGSAARLTWKNPDSPDFNGAIIVRRDDRWSQDPSDGFVVYDGFKETTIDSTRLSAEKSYYYSAFAKDEVGNISSLADNSITVLKSVRSATPEIFHLPIKNYANSGAVPIKAKIRDDLGVTKSSVYYRVKSSESDIFQSLEMIGEELDFEAGIPLPKDDGKLEYYIHVTDGQNEVVVPEGAPNQVYRIEPTGKSTAVTGSIYDIMTLAPTHALGVGLWSWDTGLVPALVDSSGYFFMEVSPGDYELVTFGLPGEYYSFERDVHIEVGTNVINVPAIPITFEPWSGFDFLDAFEKLTAHGSTPNPRRFPLSVFFSAFDSTTGVRGYSGFDSLKAALGLWEEAAGIDNLFTIEAAITDSIDVVINLIDESGVCGFGAGRNGYGSAEISCTTGHTIAHEVGHILGFGHSDSWGGGGVMALFQNQTYGPTTFESDCLRLIYRLAHNGKTIPDIEPYSIRKETRAMLASIEVVASDKVTPINEIILGRPFIIHAGSNTPSTTPQRRETEVIIRNLQVPDLTLSVPLLEEMGNANLFVGIANADSVKSGSFKIPASPGDTLEISDIAGTLHKQVVVVSLPTSVEVETIGIPNAYSLHQNYPNPFNAETTIEFDLPNSVDVTIAVYNILGEMVETIVSGHYPAGRHKAEWNAKSHASGVYLYRIESESFIKTRKFLLLK